MDSKAALVIVAVSLVESAYCVTMYLPTWTCGGAIAKPLHSGPGVVTRRMQIPRGSYLSSISGDGQSAEYHCISTDVYVHHFPKRNCYEEKQRGLAQHPSPHFPFTCLY